MNTNDFRELVRRAQAGDESAMEQVFARIRPYLTNVATELADSARASRSVSDLVQDAEIRAWRGLDQFLGGEDDSESFNKFRSWMQQILRNVAHNVHRERNTDKRRAPGYRVVSLDRARKGSSDSSSKGRLDPAADVSTASGRAVADERSARVHVALEKLDDETDREIVRAYFFDCPNLSEIARRLELPYHEVRDRYTRSMKSLEKQLGEL